MISITIDGKDYSDLLFRHGGVSNHAFGSDDPNVFISKQSIDIKLSDIGGRIAADLGLPDSLDLQRTSTGRLVEVIVSSSEDSYMFYGSVDTRDIQRSMISAGDPNAEEIITFTAYDYLYYFSRKFKNTAIRVPVKSRYMRFEWDTFDGYPPIGLADAIRFLSKVYDLSNTSSLYKVRVDDKYDSVELYSDRDGKELIFWSPLVLPVDGGHDEIFIVVAVPVNAQEGFKFFFSEEYKSIKVEPTFFGSMNIYDDQRKYLFYHNRPGVAPGYVREEDHSQIVGKATVDGKIVDVLGSVFEGSLSVTELYEFICRLFAIDMFCVDRNVLAFMPRVNPDLSSLKRVVIQPDQVKVLSFKGIQAANFLRAPGLAINTAASYSEDQAKEISGSGFPQSLRTTYRDPEVVPIYQPMDDLGTDVFQTESEYRARPESVVIDACPQLALNDSFVRFIHNPGTWPSDAGWGQQRKRWQDTMHDLLSGALRGMGDSEYSRRIGLSRHLWKSDLTVLLADALSEPKNRFSATLVTTELFQDKVAVINGTELRVLSGVINHEEGTSEVILETI